MDPERESRLRQLEDAVEAFLAKDETVEMGAFLDAHEPLRDLLRPMLSADEVQAPSPAAIRLGDLEVGREIGRGGMGVVYEAEDRRLKRRVAVKVMRRSAATPATAIVRFWREAELAAALRHPGVVPVHSVGETDDSFYLVMELQRAASLAGVLAELNTDRPTSLTADALARAAAAAATRHFGASTEVQVPPPQPSYLHAAVDVIAQVADALGHAHGQGVIHRDVKPGNILLGGDGRAHLTDFGLACVMDAPGVTQTGDTPGTPHYMAPEQARGDRAAVGPATDVFALGVTLYEMLTLRRAFVGETGPAVLLDVLHREPTDAGRLNPTLPLDLQAIVQRALEKSPARRYPTAREFAADLHAFLRGEPVVARPITRLRRLQRWTTREPWRAVAAGLVLVGTPIVAVQLTAARHTDAQSTMGARVLHEEWVDTQLAHGFREAGEGDDESARAHFAAILAEAPAREEGVAGLSVVARLQGDSAALAILREHSRALAQSPALRRREALLLRALGRNDEADAAAAGLDATSVGFDAFLEGCAHAEAGHRGVEGAHRRAAAILHRAVVTSERARPAFYYEWLHAAAHADDRDAEDAAMAAVRRLWPEEAATWFWIAFAQSERDDLEAAFASLAKALAREPHLITAVVNYARLANRLGRPGDGVAAMQAALPHAPRPVVVLQELARAHHQLGRFEAARVDLEQALVLTPRDPVLRREYAGVLIDAGRAAEGATLGEALVAERPNDPDAHLVLGMARIKLGNPAAALPHLLQSVKAKPTIQAHYYLGLVHTALGDIAAAKHAYEQVLALDGRHATAATNLAVLHLRGGDAVAAEPLLRTALTVQPDLVFARRSLLRALSDRPTEAVALCRDWLTHAPELAEAWRHLAWYLLQTGAPDVRAEALTSAEKANALSGDTDGPTLHVLGASLLASGEPERARATVQRALATLDPADRFTPYYQQQMQATLQQCEAALATRPVRR